MGNIPYEFDDNYLDNLKIQRLRDDALALIDCRTGKRVSVEVHRAIKAMLQAALTEIASADDYAFWCDNPIQEWVFVAPDDQDYTKRRNSKAQHFGCVYFATSPARPGQIKIGQTIDLIQRCKQHSWELTSPFYVFLIGKMPYHVIHERAIHDILKTNGVSYSGEWFDEQPVLVWLGELLNVEWE